MPLRAWSSADELQPGTPDGEEVVEIPGPSAAAAEKARIRPFPDRSRTMKYAPGLCRSKRHHLDERTRLQKAQKSFGPIDRWVAAAGVLKSIYSLSASGEAQRPSYAKQAQNLC